MLNDAHDIATITRTTAAATAAAAANVKHERGREKNSKLMPLHNVVAVKTETNNPTRQKNR